MISNSFGPATRSAARGALQQFLPNAGCHYAASRSFDFGPDRRDNVSTLSPYIRHRLLLEEELLDEVLVAHGPSGAQKFIEEVFWRTYFKGWLEHHPDVWRLFRDDVRKLVDRLATSTSERDRYNQAIAGQTGIDCFDAWIVELNETGYLHNHARMWFASIWIYTLGLPWQLGADWFLRHLLDGDPAANTLGWRWVGGLHTRGKTYLARVSNIANFTNFRFNPQGQLATVAPPLSEPVTARLRPLPAAETVPAGEFGLLVTEDDCSPEEAILPRKPAAAIGLTATIDRSPLPVAPGVYDFGKGAVEDALRRVEKHYHCPAEFAGDHDWYASVREWCDRYQLSALVTPWAPAGPAATRLAALEDALAKDGVTILRVRRRYDELAWPHASRGFFKLKRRIPELIEDLDLGRSLRDTG